MPDQMARADWPKIENQAEGQKLPHENRACVKICRISRSVFK